jgi:hypothetical protein
MDEQNEMSECAAETAAEPLAELESGAPPAAAEAPLDAGPAAEEKLAAITRAAVGEALTALDLTPETGRRLRDLDQATATILRFPEVCRALFESSFTVLLERLEDTKGVFAFNRQKRMLVDLLALHDMMLDLERSVPAGDPHRGNYLTLREQMLQTLAVTPILAETGARFNPSLHRAVGVFPAPDAASDGAIDSIKREGFLFGVFVLRPTEVVVRKFGAAMAGN